MAPDKTNYNSIMEVIKAVQEISPHSLKQFAKDNFGIENRIVDECLEGLCRENRIEFNKNREIIKYKR